ncbi:MAG: nitroreductase family protein [Barnesiella sp.]|nr:nitroreductase family protein [Barnesiella sp.]
MKSKSSIKAAVLSASVAAGMLSSCNTGSKEGGGADTDSTNAALECIMTRTSVREYQNRPVGRDTVEILLRAAMAAPTAVNKQPWTFVVVDEREVLDSLTAYLPYARMLAHAPLAIVTCGDMTRAIEGDAREMWVQDVSAATENLLLAAHAVGLGAVWTGVYPIDERVEGVRKALALPDNLVPLAVVPVGYPAKDSEPKEKWDAGKVMFNRQ